MGNRKENAGCPLSRPPTLPDSFDLVAVLPAIKRAPLTLGRPSLPLSPHRRVRAPVGDLGDAPGAARLVLFVESSRRLGRPALVGQRLDRDRPLELPDADRKPVADGKFLGGLYAFSTNFDLATGNRC